MSSVIPSQTLRRNQRWTQSIILHDALQSLTEHEQSPTARRTHDTIPDVTTIADQNTGTGDVTRDVRTGPTQDVTRTSSTDDIGVDVVTREGNADEYRVEHPSSLGSDIRRITTKRGPREVRDEQKRRHQSTQLQLPHKRHWTDTVRTTHCSECQVRQQEHST